MWLAELGPYLQLWKRLNQTKDSVIHTKLEEPEAGGDSPVVQFILLERFNAIRIVQKIHQSLSALSKVMKGKCLKINLLFLYLSILSVSDYFYTLFYVNSKNFWKFFKIIVNNSNCFFIFCYNVWSL